MLTLTLTITEPATERGLVLFLLTPAPISGLSRMLNDGRDRYEWTRYDGKGGKRRFIDKLAAHRVLRREIRAGNARGAKLYRSGDLLELYGRDATTGREVRLPLDCVDEAGTD